MCFLILLLALGLALKLTVADEEALDENLYALHEDLSEIKIKDCVGCHDTLNDKSLDRDIKTAHAIHEFFGAEGCLKCHKDFDLNQDSGQTLRKPVSMEICIDCHVGTSKGWKVSLSPGKG
jgi:hypothetical protein